MLVIYRITSIPSTNPSPIYQGDKDELNELCLESFLTFFEDVKPHIIFLADHTTKRTENMIWRLCTNYRYKYEIVKSNSGINQTMLDAYELASLQDDYVLMQECDYLYKVTDGKTFLRAIKALGIVSPYDHLNFYQDENLHSDTCKIKLIGDHHFRSTERNTMTWGCHSRVIKENKNLFMKYGYLDADIWYDLKDKGYDLYVPIPSYATHMVKDFLAPGVDWKELWSNTQ